MYSQSREQLLPDAPTVNVPLCPPLAPQPLTDEKTYCVPLPPEIGVMQAYVCVELGLKENERGSCEQV